MSYPRGTVAEKLAELETLDANGLVVDRVRAFLDDEAQVFDAIAGHAPDLAERRRLVARAGEIARAWPELSPAKARLILRAIVARIDILAADVEVRLLPTALCDVLRNGPDRLLAPPAAPDCRDYLTLSVPAAFTRVGKDVRLVIAGPDTTAPPRSPDPGLIRLLVKAHQLIGMLTAGEMTISDLAAAEDVHRSYIGRLLRLAYLAPDITAAVLDGRQPPGLNAKRLLQGPSLPLDWAGQWRALGFR